MKNAPAHITPKKEYHSLVIGPYPVQRGGASNETGNRLSRYLCAVHTEIRRFQYGKQQTARGCLNNKLEHPFPVAVDGHCN